MELRPLAKEILRKTGYDVIQHDERGSPVARRLMLLGYHGIDLILDVEANDGRYAVDKRENGHNGWIVSFEPIASAFSVLEKRTQKCSKWGAVPIAPGATSMKSLENMAGIPLELSLFPLDQDEPLIAGMISYLSTLGSTLMSFKLVFGDADTGQLMQVDGLFFRDRS